MTQLNILPIRIAAYSCFFHRTYVPEEVRSRLAKYCDEIDVVRIPHDVSIVRHRLVPSALVLASWGDVIVHNVHAVPSFFRLVVPKQYFNGRAPTRGGTRFPSQWTTTTRPQAERHPVPIETHQLLLVRRHKTCVVRAG